MAKYKLGDICEIVSGSTPKTSIEEYWDGDIKWITPAEINDDTYIVTDSVRKITDLGAKKTGLSPFPEGTVILSSRAPIGKVAIAGCAMCCNQGFKNLICSEKILNKYLYWFLKGNTSFLNSLGRGATFKEISKSIVSQIEINVPDIEYQKEAADILEKVSEVIYLRKQELTALDNLINARFVEMFGDITTGNYKYDTRKLGDVANVGSSHRVFTTEFVKKGIPFYRGTEIGELANGNKPTEPFYYKDGRVLCISPDREIFDTKYLEYFMKAKTLVEYPKLGSGSTFAEFKIFLLKDIDVLIPPRELQEQFSIFVNQVDKSKVAVQKALDETQMLFDSLMQEYFG